MDFLKAFNRWPMDGEKSSDGSSSSHPVEDGRITLTDGLDPIISKGVATELPVTSEVVSSSVHFKEAGNDARGYAVGGETPAEVVVKPKGRTKKSKPALEAALLEESAPVVKAETALASVKRKEKKEGKILFPQKGDVFQNVTNGDRIVVETIAKIKGEEPWIYYRETDVHEQEKIKRDSMLKMQFENFSVLVRGMKKVDSVRVDPIKKEHPKFYAMYEEQMKKLESIFSWEIETVTGALNEWSDSFDEETDTERYNELADRYSQLFEKLTEISEKWNKIKDSLVVTRGLKKIELFLELRSFLLDERIPEDIRTDIIKLRAENIDYEPNVELVEKEYQRILLDKKIEETKNKYNWFINDRSTTEQDISTVDVFADQINVLFASVSDTSSSEDIEEVLDEIVTIEKRMFEKKGAGNGRGRNENASTGGSVPEKGRQPIRGNGYGQQIRDNEERHKKNKPYRVSAKRMIVSPTGENGVEFKGEEFTAPKKAVEIPVDPVVFEQQDQERRMYNEFCRKLGNNDREIASEEKGLQEIVRAGLMSIETTAGTNSVIQFVNKYKEALEEAFSRQVVVGLSLFFWTSSEKELFAKILVKRYLEDFVK